MHVCCHEVPSAPRVRLWRAALSVLLSAMAMALAVPLHAQSSTQGAIAAGGEYTCALTDVGAQKCWGNTSTTVATIPNVIGATALSAGIYQHCALMAGVVRCTGGAAVTLPNVTAIATGGGHSCAVVAGGSVQCWGTNSSGQLGTGSSVSSSTPVTALGVSGATAIAAGDQHSCAVVGGGAVKCWGQNPNGQLGNGTTAGSLTAVDVIGVSGAIAVSAGMRHSCALLAGGGVKCWGDNDLGQLGNGNDADTLAVHTVVGIGNGVALSSGYAHTCALVTGGSVKCWGYNGYGQIGNGSRVQAVVATAITSVTGASAITAGLDHSCALVTAGAVQCWGRNDFGQLGIGLLGQTPTPVNVKDMFGATALAAGFDHTCSVVPNGAVQCWGRNDGALGNGSTLASAVAVNVTGLTGATSLAGGQLFTCARLSGGTVRCWGYNNSGELGHGVAGPSTVPVTVIGVAGATHVAAGSRGGNGADGSHACALVVGGAVKCWGANNAGQLGNGTTTPSATAVDVTGVSGATAISGGGWITCVVTAGGTVQCWGDGTTTATTVPGLSGVTAVTVGGAHACALVAGGTVRCWGSNVYAQLGDDGHASQTTPTTVIGLGGATAIGAGAGGDHTCAVAAGGSVWCWGSNSNFQRGSTIVGIRHAVQVLGITGAVAVAGGKTHSCAVIAGGSMKCWGNAFYGQLGNEATGYFTTPRYVLGAPFATAFYTLTYASAGNGSISGSAAQTVAEANAGTAVTAVPNLGHRFVQWSDGNTNATRSDGNLTANAAFTAQFAANPYTVSFDSQGGSAVDAITQDYATTVTLPARPDRFAHAFVNWNTAADGSGIARAPGATFAMPAGNQTLYAQWTLTPFALTYSAAPNGLIAGHPTQLLTLGAIGTAVTAVADANHHFTTWSDGSETATRTDTGTGQPRSLIAFFARDPDPPPPILPPVITKTFSVPLIDIGGTSGLVITVSNPNAQGLLDGIAFTDSLPAGMVVANPANLVNFCGGTATAVAGASSASVSGATLAAGDACTFSVMVTATTHGTKTNVVSVSSSAGIGNTASAVLRVNAPLPPHLSLRLLQQTFLDMGNGQTGFGVAFQLANGAAAAATSNITVTLFGGLDAPNAAMQCAAYGTGATCGAVGGAVMTDTASLPVDTRAVWAVLVPVLQNGQAVRVDISASGATPATITVPPLPPAITSAFGASGIGLGSSTTLAITLSNPDANFVQTMAFTDSLPAGLVVATPVGFVNACGGNATAVAGGASVGVTGATLEPGTSCTVKLNVTGTTVGTKTNSVQVTSTEAGIGNTSSATLTVSVLPPVITGVFGVSTLEAGYVTSLAFILANPNAATALTGVAFTDNLPVGLQISAPNNLFTNCGGTLAATAGSPAANLSGATLAPNASCTVAVDVTGTTPGVKHHSVQVFSNQGAGNTSNATLRITDPLSEPLLQVFHDGFEGVSGG